MRESNRGCAGAERIPFMGFFKRRDWNTAFCSTLSGQQAGQRFYEFFCSLALLRNDGTPKAAYQQFVSGLGSLKP